MVQSTGTMKKVTDGEVALDSALKSMNLEKVQGLCMGWVVVVWGFCFDITFFKSPKAW